MMLWMRLSMKALAAALLVVLSHSALAAWPEITLPEQVSGFHVGEELVSNGTPMRIQGFVSSNSVDEMLAWYKRKWDQPFVENTVGRKRILGRAEDGYFVTVQIEPAGRGSKALVSVADVKAGHEGRQRYMESIQHWLQRWPIGSQVISHVTSDDEGKASSHIALINGHSDILNREALINVLRQDGYVLDRETNPDFYASANASGRTAALRDALRSSSSYFFLGSGKEATATISKEEQGRTVIVLNTITAIERYKK